MSERMMDSKHLLALLFAGLNQKNLDELSDELADDAVFLFPKTAPLVGKKKILSFMKVLIRRYPNLIFTLGRMTGDETLGAVEWTNHGNAKNGEPYENAGVTFLEVRDGKIAYISDTFKDTDKF